MSQLNDQIEKRLSEKFTLYKQINPQLAKVLKTIGFDKFYTKGQGAALFDRDGNEYTDFLSGYGVFALGRNHHRIKEALKEFLDQDTPNLIQMDAPLLSGLLAERLIDLMGHGVRDTVYFTNSGTEAVETAIKFVRAATKRDKILHLDHAFHGLSTGSLALNGNKEFKDGFGDLLQADSVAMNELGLLEAKLRTKEYAAFIFEPIQGKGVYIPNKDYFTAAADLCKKYDTLVIADEIQTGLGRTGKWLACEHFGVEPDIVCLSKALSGGMVPVGAVLYKRDIYNKVFSRMDRCVVHSSTFGQNDMAMVAGLTTLQIIEDEMLIENSAKQGALLLEKLKELQSKHDYIKDVRGMGLMIGIEFGKPKGLKRKIAWNMVHKIDKGLFGELIVIPLLSQHRILTQVSGHHQDIVKLIPPLMINEKHVTQFVDSLDDVLNQCDKVSGPIFKMGKNLAKHVVKAS